MPHQGREQLFPGRAWTKFLLCDSGRFSHAIEWHGRWCRKLYCSAWFDDAQKLTSGLPARAPFPVPARCLNAYVGFIGVRAAISGKRSFCVLNLSVSRPLARRYATGTGWRAPPPASTYATITRWRRRGRVLEEFRELSISNSCPHPDALNSGILELDIRHPSPRIRDELL